MDKRIVAAGIILLIISLVFLGLSMSSSSLVMAIDNQSRTTPIVGNLMRGTLDITVTVVTPSWTVDMVNTNTGVSVKNTNVRIGTSISFSGTLKGSDGLAIPNYWVALNLLSSSLAPESGNQCWIGSAQTNSQGQFGSGYYLQAKTDGWWSNYPGVDGAYIQTKNGAGNPGCQAWATNNPAGHTYSTYAAVSAQYYSSLIPFTEIMDVSSCPITGTVYINDVAVATGASIRSPPAISAAFVPNTPPSGTSIQAVTLTGAPSGNVPMPLTGGKYVVSQTWSPGTYVVGMVVACTNGGTVPVLRMTATLDSTQGSTQVMNVIQEIRNHWLIWGASIFVLAAVVVGYGYKKHD